MITEDFLSFLSYLLNNLVRFARKMGGKKNNTTPWEIVNILDIYHESKENP